MNPFTLEQFADACGGTYCGPGELLSRQIGSVVIDSRKVTDGSVFVAVPGEHVDGHRFIPDVYQKGALCAVSQQKLANPAGPYILTDDTLAALKLAAEAYRRTLDIPVIGITGSVGKTSTKEMTAAVLGVKYRVLKTPGNFNNEIGLPLTIFMIDREHEAAVLEMGMNHFGEMRRLSRMARPTHCLFTNIGVAHLEFLGSRDGILKAKTEMLDYAAPDAKIFVNGDDDKLVTLKDRAVAFGLNPDNQIYADGIENLGMDGIRCTIHADGGIFRAAIPLPGMHMVYNALAGTAVGLSLGLTFDEIRIGIESLKPLPGRGNILRTGRYTILDDCYNANPASMCAMLDVLDGALTRKVAVLGDMGELGERSAALHASVGEHLGSLHIDVLITVGTLSEAIHQAAAGSAVHTQCFHFDTMEHFFSASGDLLREGDSVLVKASHYMEFDRIVKHLSEWKNDQQEE